MGRKKKQTLFLLPPSFFLAAKLVNKSGKNFASKIAK
jgi:hypothetical protein